MFIIYKRISKSVLQNQFLIIKSSSKKHGSKFSYFHEKSNKELYRLLVISGEKMTEGIATQSKTRFVRVSATTGYGLMIL